MKHSKVFKNKHDLIFYLSIVILPTVQFAIFYIGVNFNSILMAFQRYENGKYILVGFQNFLEVFGESKLPMLIKYGRNSLVAYAVKTLIGVSLSLVFSFYITKNLKFSGIFKVFIYLPHIVSSAVLVIMFKYFMEGVYPEIIRLVTGTKPFVSPLTKNPYPIVLAYTVWSGFGVEVLMYTGAMKQISDSISESAQVDGITPFKEMIYITLPLIFPTIITFVIVGLATLFTNQMNLYTFFTEGSIDPNIKTIGYYLYATMQSKVSSLADYPFLSALGIVLTVITAAITFALRALLNRIDPTKESRA